MKLLSKTLFVSYVLLLLWLVLFKLSYDVLTVLGHQARSLNLIPFADFSRGNLGEMISNFVVFVPLGLLLSINFKQITFLRKLAFIFLFSLAAEMIQFALAIGTTDITDVIMNTLGGLFGLGAYKLGVTYLEAEKVDRFIVTVGTVLFVLIMVLRIFVFKVRY